MLGTVLLGNLLVSECLPSHNWQYVSFLPLIDNETDCLDMNYVCVVYAIVVLLITIDWQFRGRRSFRGQSLRHGEIEAHSHVQ